MAKNRKIGFGCLFPALFIALGIWLLWPMKPGPLGVLAMPSSGIEGVIESDYVWLGLAPPSNQTEYFSTVEGSWFRCLEGRVRVSAGVALGLAWLKNTHVTVVENQREYVIRTNADVIIADYLVLHRTTLVSYEQAFRKLPPGRATELLLGSSTVGTRKWVREMPGGSRFFLVGARQEPIPPISFDLPKTKGELREYWQWLMKMAGPEQRFTDGWGHRIRLSVSGKYDTRLLTASSAGPDGKWDTKDDMVLRREIKTGKIVERIGFRQ